MKRKIMFILMLVVALSTQAQSDGVLSQSIVNKMSTDATFSFGFDHDGMHTRAMSIRSNYALSTNVYATVQMESLMGFMHESGVKDYHNTFNVGIGAGYSIIPQLDVHAIWAHTVGNWGWKYNSYEVGLTFSMHRTRSWRWGLGYRFIDSSSEGIANHKALFLSVGCRL